MAKSRGSGGIDNASTIAEGFSSGFVRGVMSLASLPVDWWLRPYLRHERSRRARWRTAGLTSLVGVALAVGVALLAGILLEDASRKLAEASQETGDVVGVLLTLPVSTLVLMLLCLLAMGVCMAIIFTGPRRLIEGQPEEDRRINIVIRSTLPGGKDIGNILEIVTGKRGLEHELGTLFSFAQLTSDKVAERLLARIQPAAGAQILDLAAAEDIDGLRVAIEAVVSPAELSLWVEECAHAAAREVKDRLSSNSN